MNIVESLEQEVAKLNKRITSLENWNREMYENHKAEVKALKRVYRTGVRMRKTAVGPCFA